eukprot:244997-Amphidinium_carterae.1
MPIQVFAQTAQCDGRSPSLELRKSRAMSRPTQLTASRHAADCVVDFGRPYTIEKRYDDFNKLYADLSGLAYAVLLPCNRCRASRKLQE